MISGALLLAVVAGIAFALVGVAFVRDRRRGREFRRLGLVRDLSYEHRGDGIRDLLSALPSMTPTRRHLFTHVLRGGDEILCDWRVPGRPKERPRRRAPPARLLAFAEEARRVARRILD